MNTSLKASCIVSEVFQELEEKNIIMEERDEIQEGFFSSLKKMWKFGKEAYRVGKKAWDVGSKVYRIAKSLKDEDVFKVLKREIFQGTDFDDETMINVSKAVSGRENQEYRDTNLNFDDILGLMSRKDQNAVRRGNIDQDDLAKFMSFIRSATGSEISS